VQTRLGVVVQLPWQVLLAAVVEIRTASARFELSVIAARISVT
jgi:hypothetical protein